MTVVYLARHGKTVWNEQRRVAGRLEAPLSDLGRRQAANLSRVLERVRLGAIFSSPLRRAQETARVAAERQGLEVRVRAELQELHFGLLQGRFLDGRDPEATTRFESWRSDPLGNRIPGGESLEDLDRRVAPFTDRVLTGCHQRPVLIVAHHYTNCVILGRLLRRPRSSWLEARPKCHYLYEIDGADPPVVSRISLGDEDLGRRPAFRY